MISPAEASARILQAVTPLPAEGVSLLDALGRYAASPILAAHPLPAYDFSAMDGYAIHTADCGGTPWLDVIGSHAAGTRERLHLSPGQAVRIFTGAPIPYGTGAVVMQEDVAATSKPARIQLKEPAAVGEFIRRTGADVCPGQILLTKGMACHAAHVGVLAAQGMTSISVGQRPRIGILTTGNEILLPGQSPSHEGQIHNSNAPALAALFHQQNLAASLTLAHAKDEMEAMQQAMTDLLEHADVLICVGGVSVGDHDLVKPALTALGVTTEFWRVAMKPGKPFLFGHQSGKYVFGLPGNPVSAFVTAFLLVLPALRKLSGAAHPEPQCTTVKLTHPMKNTDRRLTYFRGNWDRSKATFTPLGLQESHALYGLSQANALLPIPPESELAAHTMVEILPFG